VRNCDRPTKLLKNMETYYQIATKKHQALLPQSSPWFVHYKHFDTYDLAVEYAANRKEFRVLKVEVILEK